MSIKLIMDDTVKDVLDKILSGCVPHENTDTEMVPNVIIELKKAIEHDETYGVYTVLFTALDRVVQANRIIKRIKTTINREQLQSMLEVAIDTLVLDETVNMKQYLDELHINSDLTVESNIQEAVNILAQHTLDKFDDLVDMKVPTEESFNYLEDLREAILSNLAKQSVMMQAKILNEGHSERGRTFLGAKGFMEYTKESLLDMENRFKDFNTGRLINYSFNNFQKAKEFRSQTKDSVRPLMKFGFKPLDHMDISTSDVITVVGDEGVGKTGFMTDQASKAIRQGLDVLIMSGESQISKIYYTLLSIHLEYLQGIPLTWKEVMDLNLHPTDIQAKINHAEKDLVENPMYGKIYIEKDFTYDNFYSEVEHYLTQFGEKGGIVYIDHTDRLKSGQRKFGSGNQKKDNVDNLYLQAIDISDDYPVAVIMLAHTSADANKQSAKGKDVDNARIGASSSSTSKDSDMVLWLRKDSMLNQQGMIKVEVKKVREYDSHVKPFILKREGATAIMVYSEDYQYVDIDDEELEQLH